MNIRDFEYFHGAVFTRIIHAAQCGVHVRQYSTISNSSYIIQNQIAIYIKHSAKRLPPWSFTFSSEHCDEIAEMRKRFGNIFTLLICNDDGVACLDDHELSTLIKMDNQESQWVSVRRQKRLMYSISGTAGCLARKLGRSEFPERLVAKFGSEVDLK